MKLLLQHRLKKTFACVEEMKSTHDQVYNADESTIVLENFA